MTRDTLLQGVKQDSVIFAKNVFIEWVLYAQSKNRRAPDELVRISYLQKPRPCIQIDLHARVPFFLHPGREQAIVEGDKAVFVVHPAAYFAKKESVIFGRNWRLVGQGASNITYL